MIVMCYIVQLPCLLFGLSLLITSNRSSLGASAQCRVKVTSPRRNRGRSSAANLCHLCKSPNNFNHYEKWMDANRFVSTLFHRSRLNFSIIFPIVLLFTKSISPTSEIPRICPRSEIPSAPHSLRLCHHCILKIERICCAQQNQKIIGISSIFTQLRPTDISCGGFR
jgi:hypothetical protein